MFSICFADKKEHSKLPSGIAAIIQIEGGGYATTARYYCMFELPTERLLTRAAVSSFLEVSVSSDIYMVKTVIHSISTFLLIYRGAGELPGPDWCQQCMESLLSEIKLM